MPMMPELVFCSHSTSPDFASKIRNIRSLVPPAKMRSPAVAVTEPNNCDFGKLCDQTFLPVAGYFERAWRVFLSNRTEADFQAWRDQRDWTAEKYRRFNRGERVPPAWKPE